MEIQRFKNKFKIQKKEVISMMQSPLIRMSKKIRLQVYMLQLTKLVMFNISVLKILGIEQYQEMK